MNITAPLVWTQLGVEQAHEGARRRLLDHQHRSVGGLSANPILGIYNVTKAALIHLTEQLAAELGPEGAGQRDRARPGEDRLRPCAVGARDEATRWRRRTRCSAWASPTTSGRPPSSSPPTPPLDHRHTVVLDGGGLVKFDTVPPPAVAG